MQADDTAAEIATDSSTVADLSRHLAKVLERISAAERRAATQDAILQVADAEHKKAAASQDAALAENDKTKAACRELQQATQALEAECADLAERLGAKRKELASNIDEAINGANEAQAKATAEEKAELEGRIEKVSGQLAAAEKHWAAEARAKELEEQLLVARLAEADGKLREARLHVRSHEHCAAERQHLRTIEKQWTQLEKMIAKTEATMSQHDEQVAAVTAEADKLEAERDALTAKLSKSNAKRTKALEQTLPDLANRLAAVEQEQQRVKDECRELQRTLAVQRAAKSS